MKYSGLLFGADDLPDASPVSEAVVKRNRVSIDWIQEGETFHLEATSKDGWTYEGCYGYPQPDTDKRIQLRQYRGKDSLVFICNWQVSTTGEAGNMYFVLTEKKLSATTRKQKAGRGGAKHGGKQSSRTT